MTIALRVWLWAVLVRSLKHVVPLQSLVRWVTPSRRMSGIRGVVEPELASYLVARGRFPRRPPGNCLDRSLAAYRVLCRIGAQPEIVVGIRPDGHALVGHVWLVVDGKPFAERADVEGYTSIVRFDERGRRDTAVPSLTGIRWA